MLSSYLKQSSKDGQDCIAIHEMGDMVLLCLSDGAGGIGGGSIASRMVCALSSDISSISKFSSEVEFELLLREIDAALCNDSEAGEATCVLVLIRAGQATGASVGDSQCWLFEADFEYELSRLQNRKPLLGSGGAVPIGFGPVELNGSIVLGSDGLFNYVKTPNIRASLPEGAEYLVKLAENSTGYLQDDCSAIVWSTNV